MDLEGIMLSEMKSKTDNTWSYLHVVGKNKNTKLIDTENRLVVQEQGPEDRQTWWKGVRTSAYKILSHSDAIYSIMMIFSYAILHNWKLLSEKNLQYFQHKKKIITMDDDRCSPNLLWWSFWNTYKHRILMLYTWN